MSEEKLTMDDFSAELEASFKKIEEGDMLTGTVISVDEKEVILDLKYYAEGVIRAEDFSNEPGFSLKDAVQVGDEITATVIRKDDGHGNILLSRAEANDILAWEKLAQYKEEKTVLDVKVKGIVNAGVIAYVEGIRGFIPASKLSLNYVEDLNEYLNKDIQVQVFDLDKEKDRLISSGIPDTIGAFASSIDADMEGLYEQDPYKHLLVQTLSDRLAEAATEKMHEYVRKEAWGYAKDENLGIADLLVEKYQGIRPAVGYPSLPDQSVNFLLDELLDMKQIGISLTENGAMYPHASVCGLMFSHPASEYFSVGKIGEDQLEDYARRRGKSIEEMCKFLAANLQ